MPEPREGSIAWLKRRGVRPRRRLGQTFLFDRNLLESMVREAGFEGDEQALEVGAGIGNLTAELARVARRVTTIEIDPRLAALAAERLAGHGNVRLLVGDVLRGKHALSGALLEAIEEGGRPLKIVANLPYGVAAPFVAAGLARLRPARAVVTVQREVAERLVAAPGSPSYGALTVLVGALGSVRLVRAIRPEAFWPRPKVHSAVIRIDPRPDAPPPAVHEKLREVLGVAFRHPRKKARPGLERAFGERAMEGLASHGVPEGARPGEIPGAVYVTLAKLLLQKKL